MVGDAQAVAEVWRSGGLSVDKAGLLGFAYANPRTRDAFLDDQPWFLEKARRLSVPKLRRAVSKWVDVHDLDGSKPAPDPSHQRRKANLVFEHFAKAWKLEAWFGSLQGSFFDQTLRGYIKAEFAADWAAAQKIHGDATCIDLLARTPAQRRADALCQMAADAVNSDKPSAPVKRVHVIVWAAETFEEMLRRFAGATPALLDPDTYNVSDLDGNPVEAGDAFADALVSSVRRAVVNAAGVTIDMGRETRLFTGLARLGINIASNECYWPGCHTPTTACQGEHLRPAAQGGPTNQINGLPGCGFHNRTKEHGYTVTRTRDGTITITAPNGDTIP